MTTVPESPYYTCIHELDKQVDMLTKHLLGSARTDPDERIEVAETILMLQRDRKQMVVETMTKLYGAKS